MKGVVYTVHRRIHKQPLKLPPHREVQHHILVIEPNKWHAYYLPKCANYLHVQLLDKIKKYTEAGWWVPTVTHKAMPMLCIPKKNKSLQTAINLRKWNANTFKDVTPFPDQDHIRNDVAKAKYRSKIDLTNAYEQILVADKDVKKTVFATVFGMFYSHVMQIGDCNAPAMFQTLMTFIFCDYIGRFMHVYLDDMFVLKKLNNNKFYLQEEKVQLYASELDCLGHMIDGKGIHAAEAKMHIVRDWCMPRSYNDVQRFLRLVQYTYQKWPITLVHLQQ